MKERYKGRINGWGIAFENIRCKNDQEQLEITDIPNICYI